VASNDDLLKWLKSFQDMAKSQEQLAKVLREQDDQIWASGKTLEDTDDLSRIPGLTERLKQLFAKSVDMGRGGASMEDVTKIFESKGGKESIQGFEQFAIDFLTKERSKYDDLKPADDKKDPKKPPPLPQAKTVEAAAEAMGLEAMAAKVIPIVGTAMMVGGIWKNIVGSVIDYAIDGAEARQQRHQGLSGLSGSMASVMANRDVMEMMRDMRVGNKLASSAATLTAEEQQRKNMTEALSTAAEKFENNLLAALNSMMITILERLAPVTDKVTEGLDLASIALGDVSTFLKLSQEQNESVGATLERFNVTKVEKDKAVREQFDPPMSLFGWKMPKINGF
jgi:hypothetical protein